MINIRRIRLVITLFLCTSLQAIAQTDTLRVMAYNVLYYGDRPACQGPHDLYHNYLKTIAGYANADIIGLEKMAAIPAYPGDVSGSAPAGFGDSILFWALNAAYAGRYACCPFTNASGGDNISMLFYDQQKLGFLSIASSYSNITDFNTYLLYYKSPGLATTHDTIFLYITLNHDNSGSGSSDATIRGNQIQGEMAQIATHFSALPNMLNMGDFNTHNSDEACYQALVNPANPAFRFYDPPFAPDASVSYPADWDNNPASYAAFLTTSTRLSGSVPNSCGTSGGGKSWYDHIFVSQSIIQHTSGIAYIPHSYRTLGNDGNRTGISVNDAPANTAVSAAVADALFQMSNKYPVMVNLLVSPTASGIASLYEPQEVTVPSPVHNMLQVQLAARWAGTTMQAICSDMAGRVVMNFACNGTTAVPCGLAPGTYVIHLFAPGQVFRPVIFTKE